MESEEKESNHSSPNSKYTGGEGCGKRILVGTAAAAGVGATIGVIGGIAKEAPLRSFAVPVTINFAIAGSLFCGMTEFTREMLKTEPGHPINTVGGGLITGTLLARFQGIHAKPVSMGLLFAAVGTSLQLAMNAWEEYRLRRFVKNLPEDAFPEDFRQLRKQKMEEEKEGKSWPEWLPIRKLSDEEVARREEIARRMREQSRIEE